MQVWADTITTMEARKRLEKSQVEILIDSKYVSILIIKPDDANDQVFCDLLRKAFLNGRLAAKNKMACFRVNHESFAFLIANDRNFEPSRQGKISND